MTLKWINLIFCIPPKSEEEIEMEKYKKEKKENEKKRIIERNKRLREKIRNQDINDSDDE
jgi:hypothetical protein